MLTAPGWHASIRAAASALGVALALADASPHPARAQATSRAFGISGIVQDSAGRPLEGAEVFIDSQRVALTAADGAFLIPGVKGAPAHLRVRRLGYDVAERDVAPPIEGDRRSVVITLVPNALQLGTIVVEGQAFDTRLWNAGFYKRARLGVGRFVGPDELERFAGGLATVLRETPRVQIERQNNQDHAYARAGGASLQDERLRRWPVRAICEPGHVGQRHS